MPIKAANLYQDSIHFYRNQWVSIVLIALISSLIAALLNFAFTAGSHGIEVMQQIESSYREGGNEGAREVLSQVTDAQQMDMVKTGVGVMISSLFGNALFVSSIMTLIIILSQGHYINGVQAVIQSFNRLPKMMLMLFICTLVIQLGLMAMRIPGLMFAFLLALAPIIMCIEKNSIFVAIRESGQIALKNWKVILPAILLWFVFKYALVEIIQRYFSLDRRLVMLTISFVNNLFSALVLIYLSRFYQLTKTNIAE